MLMLQAKMNGVSRPQPQATSSQENRHISRQSSFGSRPDIIGGRPNTSTSVASSFLLKHSSHKPYKVDGENSLFDSNLQGSSGKKPADCLHD